MLKDHRIEVVLMIDVSWGEIFNQEDATRHVSDTPKRNKDLPPI